MAHKTIAFDVYGTLIDTAAVVQTLHEHTQAATVLARRWREKQLEYTFRRALMDDYVSFSQCTSEALNFALAEQNIIVDESARCQLMAIYDKLSAFEEAKEKLAELSQNKTYRLYAFSNGERHKVEAVLAHNALADFFSDIVSVDEIKIFKPATQVYEHFLRRADSVADDTWLVSGNPFDIIGATACGWNTAWINRAQTAFDPWAGYRPSVTLSSLRQLFA